MQILRKKYIFDVLNGMGESLCIGGCNTHWEEELKNVREIGRGRDGRKEQKNKNLWGALLNK